MAVRQAAPSTEIGQDLFDRIDANRDGVISRREFNDALRAEGDKPVLQPVDGSKPIPVSVLSADGKNRLPALPKEDSRFPAAATAAKEYLESHNLLPFVRALLQTVVREQPDDPFQFISDQFRNVSYVPKTTKDLARKSGAKLAEASITGTMPQQLESQAGMAKKSGVKLAEASLEGTLPSKLGESAARAGESKKLREARDAIQDALLSQAADMGVSLDKLTPQEMANTGMKAQAALTSVIISATQDMKPGDTKPEDIEDAKARARQALGAALKSKEGASPPGDVEDAKAKARSALTAAMTGQEASEIDEAKLKARGALAAALEGKPDVEEDAEEAKAKARSAILSVSGAVGPEVGEVEVKDKAVRALTTALLEDRAVSSATLYPEGESDDVEEAKIQARNALAAALLGGPDSHLEGAKARARQALHVAMVEGDDSLISKAQEVLETTMVVEAAQAQNALAQALLVEASRPQEASADDDGLSARSRKKKAQLTATKEELGRMNYALKEEVSELNQNFEKLKQEQTKLRLKMGASS